jgi:hypothetical protein
MLDFNTVMELAQGDGAIANRSTKHLWALAKSAEVGDVDGVIDIFKAEGVNYPLQGQPFNSQTLPGGQFAPLIPQSIDAQVRSISFTNDHLRLVNMLGRTPCMSTVYEYVMIETYGDFHISSYTAEGRVPSTSKMQSARRVKNIKYMSELFEITAQAEHVGNPLGGPVLGQRSAAATFMLLAKLEKDTMWASSAVNPLASDGLLASIKADMPGNINNAGGNAPSVDRIHDLIAKITQQPYWGRPNVVFMTPGQWSQIAKDLDLFARAKFNEPTKGFRLGADGVMFVSPDSGGPDVRIERLHFLDRSKTRPALTAGGDAPPAAAPTVVITRQAAQPGSFVTAADVAGWDYHFITMAKGDLGYTVSAPSAAVNLVAAGDGFRVDVADTGLPVEGSASVKYYQLYAARVPTGAGAPTDRNQYSLVFEFARNVVNAGNTRATYLFEERIGTSPIIVGELTPDTFEYIQFLPFTQRELPSLELTRRALNMAWLSPVLRMPSRFAVDMAVRSDS